MNWRDLPPLAALRAFTAYVECGSVVDAGAALGVSHAAVSQQLRALEDHLDVALFDRSGRTMELTAMGEILAQGCIEGFAQINRALALVTGSEAARPLHISTTPSFAAAWLMPRLPEFRDRHPEINLVIDAKTDVVTLSPGGVDAAIRYGMGGWPGVEDQCLIASPMVIVAAPRLINGRDVSSPAAIGALPWLEEIGSSESTRWLERIGAKDVVRGGYVQMPGNLLLDGARDGQGVAVTVRLFVEADIRAGRLIVLHEEREQQGGYHLVTRPGVQRPALRAFTRWITRAVKDLT